VSRNTDLSNLSGLRGVELVCEKRLSAGMNGGKNMLRANCFGKPTSLEHHPKQAFRSGNRQDNSLSCQLSTELL
jgi:hypothetical protein